MNWIPLTSAIIAGLVLVGLVIAYLSDLASRPKLLIRLTTMVGGLLALVAFFSLPWVEFVTPEGIQSILASQEWGEVVQGVSGLEGFRLLLVTLITIPASPAVWMTIIVAITVAWPVLTGLMALLGGVLHLFLGAGGPDTYNAFTFNQFFGGFLAFILLLLERGAILTLGIADPLFAETFLRAGGAELGSGVWTTVAALLVLIAGALVDYIYYWGNWSWEYE